LPTGREPYGNGVPRGVCGRESRPPGEGGDEREGIEVQRRATLESSPVIGWGWDWNPADTGSGNHGLISFVRGRAAPGDLPISFLQLCNALVLALISVTFGFELPDIVLVVFFGSIVAGFTGLELLFIIRSWFVENDADRFGAIFSSVVVVGVLLFYSFVFGSSSHYLFSLYGEIADVPHIADGNAFAYSWFVDTVTFNASQIWAWLPTAFRPSVWWSNMILWLFCLVSDFILYAGLINALRLVWSGVTGRGIEQKG
jgi:hypothetical protein